LGEVRLIIPVKFGAVKPPFYSSFQSRKTPVSIINSNPFIVKKDLFQSLFGRCLGWFYSPHILSWRVFPDYFLDEFLSRPGAVPVQPGGGTAATVPMEPIEDRSQPGGSSFSGDFRGRRRHNLVKFAIFSIAKKSDGIRQYYYVFSLFLFGFCASLGIELAFFCCRPVFPD